MHRENIVETKCKSADNFTAPMHFVRLPHFVSIFIPEKYASLLLLLLLNLYIYILDTLRLGHLEETEGNGSLYRNDKFLENTPDILLKSFVLFLI